MQPTGPAIGAIPQKNSGQAVEKWEDFCYTGFCKRLRAPNARKGGGYHEATQNCPIAAVCGGPDAHPAGGAVLGLRSLFFLSLNDTLPAQSTQTTPIQYNGWVYVPVNVFSSRITGINFGVYYGVTENGSSILLYNLSGRSITFDLTNGTAVTSEGRPSTPAGPLPRMGSTTFRPTPSAGILA